MDVVSVTIKSDLRSRFAALSAITSASAVVDIDRSNQGASTPRVIVQRSAYRNFPTLGGVDDTLIFEQFTIDCYGNTTLQAEQIADAIAEDIEDMSGNVGSVRRVNGTGISGISDTYTADEMGGDAGESVVTITCEIQHSPQ